MEHDVWDPTAEVRAGIDLLDKQGPDGWRGRIDKLRLNMASVSRCVLGQVYGTVDVGLTMLGVNDPDRGIWMDQHGFNIGPGADFDEDVFGILKSVWIRELDL